MRAAALLLLLLLPLPSAGKIRKVPDHVPHKYHRWLEMVELLIDKKERKAFYELEKDYQRDAFIERFWTARDPYPDTARNEFRDVWSNRVEYAEEEYGNLTEDRARMLLLNGAPTQVWEIPNCRLIHPIVVWKYPATDQVDLSVVLIFYQERGFDRWRLWRPADGVYPLVDETPELFAASCGYQTNVTGLPSGMGLGAGDAALSCLLRRLEDQCVLDFDELREVRGAFGHVLQGGPQGFEILLSRLEARPDPEEGEWLDNFAAYSTDLPDDADQLPAEVEVLYPGKDSFRTVVQTVVRVPAAEAATVELAGRESYNFLLTGEVLKDGALFEGFRYKFDQPADQLQGESIPMLLQRSLRPDTYTLVFKLEDLNAKRFFRYEGELVVPKVDEELPPPPMDARTAALFEEANKVLDPLETRLRLVAPEDQVQTGMVRFDTLVVGEEFDKVTFFLNGKAVLTKGRPPYSVELDLGRVPRTHQVRVVGYDGSGEALASDEIELNTGRHRFAVRLVEPRPGKTYRASLVARAAVDTPEDTTLDRVEIYLGDTLAATLYQEPYVQPLVLPDPEPAEPGFEGALGGGPLTYVRAVAYLADGNTTEDVVFINSPDYIEQVDVQFVELYTSVFDGSGRPVDGLGREAFQVREDGVPQEVTRFEQVRDLPIHAGILFDTSASMDEELFEARAAAIQFFEEIITPKDRAAVVTFNDRPRLAVEFTNDIQELAVEMAGLKAERGTALWDSLSFTLYYFNGIKGQRAILLLSDGKDESSRLSFQEALAYAQTAGVTLYTIGLDLPRKDIDARSKLTKLATATGGRSFFIKDAAELAAIYSQIQRELRSQYLLAYQSSNNTGSTNYRAVEVDAQGAAEVKTLTGYYP